MGFPIVTKNEKIEGDNMIITTTSVQTIPLDQYRTTLENQLKNHSDIKAKLSKLPASKKKK
jgi:hypothetical protein